MKLDKNIIIQGDNINSLHKLIDDGYNFDVIYIDPPYNTNLKDLGYSDIFSKSNWYNFIYERLILAKELMSDESLIFISIDEKSFTQLKMACDKIFGIKNQIQTFIWKCRGGANDSKTNASCNHEYILCYSKNAKNIRLKGNKKTFDNYKNPDNDPNGPWIKDGGTAASGTDDYIYDIINPYTKEVYKPPIGRYWAFPKYRVEEWTKSGKIVFGKNIGEGMTIKRYKKDIRHDELTVSSTILVDEKQIYTQKGTKELRRIFPEGCNFKYPKPVELISYLISLHKNKDANVLDFFAGSGTTGQSVVGLNNTDSGNRHFVLCTNNENNICQDVTCERMNRLNIPYDLQICSDLTEKQYINTDNIDNKINDILNKNISNKKKIKLIKNLFN